MLLKSDGRTVGEGRKRGTVTSHRLELLEQVVLWRDGRTQGSSARSFNSLKETQGDFLLMTFSL